MNDDILSKYEDAGLSLTEKIQLMELDLLDNGFRSVGMKGSNKNLNYAYLSENSDYVVIIIEPVSTNGRKYFCILSREVYEQNKELIFSVQSNRHNISEDILDTSEYRIMVYRSGIVDVPTSIWERIVEKGDLPDIDHQYVRRHIVGGANRTLISVLSPLRLCRTGTCRRLQTG